MHNSLSLKAKMYHYSLLFFVFAFMVSPIIATLLYSLSTSWGASVLPDGLSFKWYIELFNDTRFLESLLRSFIVCFGAIFLALIVIFPMVLLANLYYPKLKAFFNVLVIMPFAVPGVVSCVGLLQLYAESLVGSAYILLFVYVIVCLPFIYRALENAISPLNLKELMDSNAMLGGSFLKAIFQLVLPNIKNGILVAAFLSFSFLVGDFLFANLLVGSSYETLQVYLYHIRGKSGHYASAFVFFYFFLIFLATFIASIFSIKE